MGVENLYPYVRSSIQETFVFKKVNPDLDENFNYKEIIFDGTCWLWRYMKGNYLMDYNALKLICEQMVNKLKQFGFKLVVFMDANICYNKLETWLCRRASRSNLIFEFNNVLRKHGGNYPNPQNHRYWFANNGCYFFVGQIFKSCGCDVYYAHIDCDREMVGYYKLNKDKAFAICSVDSDFFIFDVGIYLEMITMQFHNHCLHFKGYKHERILKRFQLKQHHLSQLAAIMGCDVLPRSTAYIAMINKLYRGHISLSHGEVDVIAKYLRDLETNERKFKLHKSIENEDKSENIKQMTQKKHKKKRNKGNKGNKRNKMDITKIRYNSNIKRKFAICDNFYTPIYPLGLLDSPYLIMLMFQDYNDCIEEDIKMNVDNPQYNKGVILDGCYDDTSLVFPNECSAVILSELRKYLYLYLMDNDNDMKYKDIICFPFKKYNLHPTLLMNKWKKGVIVDLNTCDVNDNPLLKMKCYQFIKEHNGNCDCIPCDLMVQDIVFLLKWLQLKNNVDKMTQKNDKMAMDVETVKVQHNTAHVQNISSWSTSKGAKKRRRQKLKEMKRMQAMEMLNHRSVYESSNVKQKNDEENENDKCLKHTHRNARMWDTFELILESFVFQWKYRNVFVCNSYRNDIIYEKSKCDEYMAKYQKRMSPISMHFQSIIYGIYEIIFAFLRLQTNNRWFKKLYHDKERELQCFKIYDHNMDEMQCKLDEWSKILLQSSNCTKVGIPYCWDLFNVKLYHWIFHNMDVAKQWINDCID